MLLVSFFFGGFDLFVLYFGGRLGIRNFGEVANRHPAGLLFAVDMVVDKYIGYET